MLNAANLASVFIIFFFVEVLLMDADRDSTSNKPSLEQEGDLSMWIVWSDDGEAAR